jgi:hypothetical protein
MINYRVVTRPAGDILGPRRISIERGWNRDHVKLVLRQSGKMQGRVFVEVRKLKSPELLDTSISTELSDPSQAAVGGASSSPSNPFGE